MSDIISRFEEDLQLAGYAKRSIQSYVAGVGYSRDIILQLRFMHALPADTIRVSAYIVRRLAPGRAVPVGRGPGEVREVASGVLLPCHAAN